MQTIIVSITRRCKRNRKSLVKIPIHQPTLVLQWRRNWRIWSLKRGSSNFVKVLKKISSLYKHHKMATLKNNSKHNSTQTLQTQTLHLHFTESWINAAMGTPWWDSNMILKMESLVETISFLFFFFSGDRRPTCQRHVSVK